MTKDGASQRMTHAQILPNVITAFGLTCGLFVIFKTNMTDIGGSTYETIQVSVLLLLLAAVADTLDGAIARATQGESEFGGNFDSLSDAIVFGVAPSVLMLKALSVEPGTRTSFLVTSGAMVYSVCGVLRLVRFNTNTNLAAAEKSPYFSGLPIPAAAAAAISANLFLLSDDLESIVTLSNASRSLILASVMFLLGYLMLSRVPFPSIKALRFRVPSFPSVFFSVVGAVMIFFGLLYHFALVFIGVSWAYVVAASILALKQRVSKP